jgi:predicted PurR-regulated permease PerM
MEFFLPGAFLFIVSILITYTVIPHLTPIITAILSIVFLTFGVYTHYQLFSSEYRLSTWQEGLKIYAPAVMIIAIILFIIYGMVAMFTGVHVPIPSMPNLEMPSTNSLTGSVMNTYNSVTNSISNSITNVAKNTSNSLGNAIGNNTKKNGNKSNVSRSFVETF